MIYSKTFQVIIGTSVLTASSASLLLGSVIMFIIIISKRLKLNPDNIATPIASSLGDLVTLAILSGVGTGLYLSSNYFFFIIIIKKKNLFKNNFELN
jgi:solute carrier family 41